MKKFTWCGVAQSPYNDFLLSVISKSFDVEVYYRIKKMKTHPWEIKSVEYRLNYTSGNFIKSMRRVLASDIVMVSGWSYWQHILIMLIPMASTKKVYWTDTPDLDPGKWSGVKGYIRRLIVKLVFNTFDQVWSTGKPGCAALEKLGCKKTKIKSFPFFHDLSRYTNIDSNKMVRASAFKHKHCNRDTEVIFLVMGQIVYKKRFDDAIHALANLNNPRAILWVVGAGPQEAEFSVLASKLEVASTVKFIGWLQPDDVELAFMACDVFVHPSDFDPFPTVVLDAMTWGKPIIGTHQAGSVSDRIEHGKNGFIYQSGDVSRLTEHMNFFLRNREEITKFGMESRQTACDYPVSIAIDRFRSLLREPFIETRGQ